MSDIEIKLNPFTNKEKSVMHKLVHEQELTECGDSIIKYFANDKTLFNKLVTANFTEKEGYSLNDITDVNEILKITTDCQNYLKKIDKAGNTSCALILGIKKSYDVLKSFDKIDLKFFIDQENIYGQSPLFIMAKYNIKDFIKVLNDGHVTKDKLMNKDIYGHNIMFYVVKYNGKEFNKLLSEYKKNNKNNILKELFGEITLEEVLDINPKKSHTETGYSNNKNIEKDIDKLFNKMDVLISL